MLVLLTIATLLALSEQCQEIRLIAEDGSVVVGRSMERRAPTGRGLRVLRVVAEARVADEALGRQRQAAGEERGPVLGRQQGLVRKEQDGHARPEPRTATWIQQ